MFSGVVAADVAGVIEAAAELVRSGGLVAFPTETVYGLGANALDPAAVARIFEAKQRPSFDPLIVHVTDDDMLGLVVKDVPPLASRLIEMFWPGPLTIVLPKTRAVPPIVTSGLETVGVRSPAHPVARQLIAQAGVPLAAPSANPFGQLSPTRAAHVERGLGNAVDLIVDGGPTQHGVESTICTIVDDRVVVLRHGAITVEQLVAVGGVVVDGTHVKEAPSGPGQLEKHYAPRTPLRFHATASPSNAAYVAFKTASGEAWAEQKVLSPSGDLREAAAALFEILHDLDQGGYEEIVVELVPSEGLGKAINDRLQRAAATFAIGR